MYSNNTMAQTRNVIDNVSVNNAFSYNTMLILKAIKFYIEWSYDKQNLTRVVISYEFYKTRRRSSMYLTFMDQNQK